MCLWAVGWGMTGPGDSPAQILWRTIFDQSYEGGWQEEDSNGLMPLLYLLVTSAVKSFVITITVGSKHG